MVSACTVKATKSRRSASKQKSKQKFSTTKPQTSERHHFQGMFMVMMLACQPPFPYS
jgi:hypothetical protein